MNTFGQIPPAGNRRTIKLQDFGSGHHARLRRWHARNHLGHNCGQCARVNCHLLHRHPSSKRQGSVHQESEDEIHQHTSAQHVHFLPGVLGHELIRSTGGLGVQALVNEPGHFHISAYRQQTDAVFGVTSPKAQQAQPK